MGMIDAHSPKKIEDGAVFTARPLILSVKGVLTEQTLPQLTPSLY
jgi:hypothetical protein